MASKRGWQSMGIVKSTAAASPALFIVLQASWRRSNSFPEDLQSLADDASKMMGSGQTNFKRPAAPPPSLLPSRSRMTRRSCSTCS
eukprot:scaffold697_cov235-Pinguiococcus_pyrenoidosus.AAC.8